MIYKKGIAIGLISLFLSVPVFAQERVVTIATGTRVPFMFQNDVTSANLKKGQELEAHTSADVVVDDCVVFPKHSTVLLRLGKIKKAGGAGGGGLLNISDARLVHSSNKASYPLNFSYRAKGKGYVGLTLPMAFFGGLLLPIFGLGAPLLIAAFAIHGKDATMSGNALYNGLTTSPIVYQCASTISSESSVDTDVIQEASEYADTEPDSDTELESDVEPDSDSDSEPE
jgi:hypothetical protein